MANASNKTTYILDSQNNIAARGEGAEPASGVARFSSQEELEDLAADWPGSRLVEVWNRLPGSTPVKKFTNRKTAIRRIWQALQLPAKAEQPGLGKPKRSRSKAKAIPAKRPGSKSETVLALLRRTGGATLRALMAATGWQAHSVRGFISGQLSKKMRLKVKSFKRDGERVYSVRS